MSESATESLQAALLSTLARVKNQSRSDGELKKWLTSASARQAGFDDEATGDRVIAAAIEAGFVEELIRGDGSSDGAAHPRSKSTYRLTPRGAEEAKRLARPARPGISNLLIECQHSYLLFQFLRTEDRRLPKSKLNQRLKSTTGRVMSMDKEAIDYALAQAVEKGHLVEHLRGNSLSYELTDEGTSALTEVKQYPSSRLTLTGDEWNRFVEVLALSLPPATTSLQPTPHTELPPAPPAKQLDESGVLRIAAALHRSDYPHTEMIPIPEVRRLVAEEYGPAAAKHDVFDPLLHRLRRDGRARLMAISDLRDATAGQLADAIPGMNETLYYLVLTKEPSHV